MTPFSAPNQGGLPEATTAHEFAQAPALPAFSIPTFDQSHLRLSVGADTVGPKSAGHSSASPTWPLAPFALAAHQPGGQVVEDGPVAFSIASSLLDVPPGTAHSRMQSGAAASPLAHDVDLANFAELQLNDHEGVAAGPMAGSTHQAMNGVSTYQSPELTFGELAHLAPMPQTHSAPNLAFPASVTGGHAAAEPALKVLFTSVVRTRLMALGRVPRQRSVHEWVFLMLAFAVMALLAAPPLVAIFLSMHGVKP